MYFKNMILNLFSFLKNKLRYVLHTILMTFLQSNMVHIPYLYADTHQIPKSHEKGRVLTLNKTGTVLIYLDDPSKKFLSYVDTISGPILEIGAGYGYVTQEVLKKNKKITANDLEIKHLKILHDRIPSYLRRNLTLSVGRLPNTLNFNEGSFSAIYCSRVLHFLNGKELEQAAKLMYKWLLPGGKVFITVDSPYMKAWKKFIPVYEKRKKLKEEYPGLSYDLKKYNPERAKTINGFFHFLDPDILVRVFKLAGFHINSAHFIDRPDYPDVLRYDGRESVMLIATKPKKL